MDYIQFYEGYAPEDVSVCYNGEFIHQFPEGFRPAKFTMHRDQYGDRCVIVKANDSAYNGKFDFDPYAHIKELIGDSSEWIEMPSDSLTEGSPRAPDNGTNPPYEPNTPSPWTPPIYPIYPPIKPPYVCNPMIEKCDIVIPPIDPPIDPSPVPLPASIGLLFVGMVILAKFKKKRS